MNQQLKVVPISVREFHITPTKRVSLASLDHPLTKIVPKTKLGSLALQLAQATTINTLSISATSAYVYALISATTPIVHFREPPPGTHIDIEQLQTDYQNFQTSFATLQGQASVWINTDQSTGQTSILSNLVSVPTTLSSIDATVQSKFTLLNTLDPSSPVYQQTLNDLKTLVGVEKAPVTSLITQITSLATTIQTAASSIQTAVSTGTLKELQDAFAEEIKALNDAIDSANDTISSDNSKIVGLGFGAATAITVGLVGLANIWNPVGWILIAGGAIGAYFAIAEILALKGEIAVLESQIKTDTAWASDDSAVAASLKSFASQLTNIANMTASVQKELTQLENLYDQLADDIGEAVKDLADGDISAAQTEWNTIVQEVAFLKNITAYVWPNPIQLTNPTHFTAAGSTLYSINNAGDTYSIAADGTSWSELSGTSLSISTAGSIIAAIDGAPVPNPSTGNPPNSTFYAKQYASGAWTTISSFAVAQIITDGTSIYAIKQETSDRQVYQYNGSGTDWTKLADLPDSDAPSMMAIANGNLYVVGNNTQKLFLYSDSSWSTASDNKFSSISGNGKYLGLVNNENQASVWDLNSNTQTNTYSTALKITQMSNGDQYALGKDQNLYYISASSYSSATLIQSDIVDVVASDSDQVFSADNKGDVYSFSGQTPSKLPTPPSAGNH